MLNIQIDHQVPVPPTTRNGKYPFAKMAPGDSFRVDEDDFIRASRSAYAFAHKHDAKFVCRSNLNRIWRV